MVRRHRRPSSGLLPRIASAVALAAVVLGGAAPPAAAADFPPRDSLYHSYDEMVTEINAVAAAHPDIVEVAVIGPRATAANALSTAICVAGEERAGEGGRPTAGG